MNRAELLQKMGFPLTATEVRAAGEPVTCPCCSGAGAHVEKEYVHVGPRFTAGAFRVHGCGLCRETGEVSAALYLDMLATAGAAADQLLAEWVAA